MRPRVNIVQVGIAGCLASIASAACFGSWVIAWLASVALVGFGIGLFWKGGGAR